jgi:hypothetical protein
MAGAVKKTDGNVLWHYAVILMASSILTCKKMLIISSISYDLTPDLQTSGCLTIYSYSPIPVQSSITILIKSTGAFDH